MMIFGKNFIKLITYINAGLSIVDINYEAIILDINCNNVELGQKIKKVLTQSTIVQNGRKRTKNCQESINNQSYIKNKMNEQDKVIRQKYTYKSKKNYERDLMYIFLKLSSFEYVLSPSHTNKNGSTTLDKDITLALSATDEEIGIVARKTMLLCTSIYK